MKIELNQIKVRDLVKNFINNNEEGVFGWDNRLNIRPKYQREFIYKDKQRDAVIKTVRSGFPLNVMYWAKNTDDTYELLDGQQRTISICDYVTGKFSLNYQYFHNLEQNEKDQILDYELMIYFCEGTDKEKLDWFKIINIAGEKLTEQELRNAIYTGPWLESAKKYFSKTNCLAMNIAREYLSGHANRQDYLETAIDWISEGKIEDYMALNQNKPNANELSLYFQSVIAWVKLYFPVYRTEMKGLDWGKFYNKYRELSLDSVDLEERIKNLMMDEEITNKKGIYEYLLSSQEKCLNIRAFTPRQKREAYERQLGVCVKCNGKFKLDEMEADHITPWSEGGKTDSSNCQMLCKKDNRTKSNK